VNGMPVGEGVLSNTVTRFTTLKYVMNFRPCAGFSLVCEWPLLAESGPSILWILGHLNVRFGEKRTFRNIPKIFAKLTNLERPLYAPNRTLS